ncbi:MAG: hypothetical protein ACK45I_05060 [Bacteroidota bacterium]|jgi:hypothetical protein
MQILSIPDRLYEYLTNENKPEKGFTLGLFRIVFAAQLLLWAYHTHVYKALLFDSVAGISKSVFPFNVLLFLWICALSCILIGLYTHFAAVANYVCIILISEVYVRNGVGSYYDDVMKMGSILLITLPTNARFSIDSILFPALRNQCTKLHYVASWILLFGLMYFMSGSSKVLSPVWQKGLGLWTPLSMPYWRYTTWLDGIQDIKWLMMVLNYAVIAWEIGFVFLLFSKRWQKVAILAGMLFHLAIAACFYFPQTALSCAACYVLFIPDRFWEKLYVAISTSKKITVFVPDTPLSARYFQFIKSLDFRNKFIPAYDAYEADLILNSRHAVGTALSAYVVYKPLSWWLYTKVQSGTAIPAKQQMAPYFRLSQQNLARFVLLIIGLYGFYLCAFVYSKWRHQTDEVKSPTTSSYRERGFKLTPLSICRTFLGINSKAVFTDKAMMAKRSCYAITYLQNGRSYWLPMLNHQGIVSPDTDKQGSWWKLHHFAITESQEGLNEQNLIRNSVYLLRKQGINLQSTHFRVLERQYVPPDKFEQGYYAKMYKLPWYTCGFLVPDKNLLRFIPARSHKSE